MPLKFVTGDPLLTQCAMLAVGHNAAGRSELDTFSTRLLSVAPAAYSAYLRKAQRGQIKTGSFFVWRETKPALLFLCVRDSAVGATRLRYVQAVCISLARDYKLYQLTSLAIAPTGNAYEAAEIHKLYELWFKSSKLEVVVYTSYQAGLAADEGF